MLHGIRILDFSQYIPGPFASMRLADLGAEVIKVEALHGDPARKTGETEKEKDVIFLANNRNKKSIAINLKTKEGLHIIHSLIKETDIIIESFRPGVMKKLGISYEDAKEIKQDIIYCSLSGYGQDGNLSNLGSHDLNYMAISGVLSQLKDYNGRPVHPTITFADLIGGIAANEQILASLFKRERTNEGSFIDAAVLDSMFSLMNTHINNYTKANLPNGISLISGKLICYSIYETSDNRYVALGALEPKFWTNFCTALDKTEWIDMQYTETNEDNSVFISLIDFFKSKTMNEWAEFGLNVDCCLTPILEVGELADYPYVKYRELMKLVSPELIQISTNYQTRLTSFKQCVPPKKGEHTNFILKELGYTEQQIQDFIYSEIVG